jgi:positive regulator of sigma E activity
MELVSIPLTLIGQDTIVVIKLSVAIHRVVFPLTYIVSPIFVVESSLAVSLLFADETAVLPSIGILFFFVLSYLFMRRYSVLNRFFF